MLTHPGVHAFMARESQGELMVGGYLGAFTEGSWHLLLHFNAGALGPYLSISAAR